MFSMSVLGERGWNTKSVSEDIEFTLNSIADGYFVAYAPDALFYDEQPLTFAQSLKQRYRWSLGGLQILSISTPKLIRAMLSGTKKTADALLYSIGVLMTSVSAISGVVYFIVNMISGKAGRSC